MRKVIFLLIVFNWSLGYAQIDITKYYNPGIPIVNDTYRYLKIDFAWNMEGKLQALINEGINGLDEGNEGVALANLNKAIKLDSSSWISHYYRGVCHKRLNNFTAAKQDFLTALSFSPTLAEAHIELGEIYFAEHEVKKAIDQFDDAIKKKPGLAEGYFYKANAALIERNTTKATRLYEKSTEVNAKFADGYFMQAFLELIVKKDDTEALALFNKSIEADSLYSLGYFWRGFIAIKQNRTQDCLKDWNKVVQLNPQNPFFLFMRGYLLIELNEFDKAFIDLRNAFKAQEVNVDKYTGEQTFLDKQIDLLAAANYLIAHGYGLDEDAFLYLKKSFCFVLSSRYKEALENINLAQQKEPSATVYLLKAVILEHLNNHGEAFNYYTLALSLDPDIYDAHRKRCVYNFELQDWKKAYIDLNNMFRLQPGSAVAHRLRGLIRFAQGFYGSAISDLTAFIKTDTTDVAVYKARSFCYATLGKFQESQDDLLRLVPENRLDWSLHESIINNYLQLHDTTQALATIDHFQQQDTYILLPYMRRLEIYTYQKNEAQVKATVKILEKRINPVYQSKELSKIHYYEGLLAFYLADYSEAISSFNKALKKDPKHQQAQYQRAKTYLAVGQPKKALADLKELADADFKDSKSLYESTVQEK